MLGLCAKEVGEKGECLGTDVVEGVKGEGFENLEDGEKVFLEPVLEVPDEEMLVLDIRVE